MAKSKKAKKTVKKATGVRKSAKKQVLSKKVDNKLSILLIVY